jgi:hypothetical protein
VASKAAVREVRNKAAAVNKVEVRKQAAVEVRKVEAVALAAAVVNGYEARASYYSPLFTKYSY